EGVAEVGDDVVCILTAYGDTEQPRGDARRFQLLLRELAMARRGRVGHNRVDSAEACRPQAELEAVHEGCAGLASAHELDRKHPAGRRELALRQLVLGIALEPGVVDARDLRVRFEEAGDYERVG